MIPNNFLQVLLAVNNSLIGDYRCIQVLKSTYVVGKSCIFLDETPKKSSTACTVTKHNRSLALHTIDKEYLVYTHSVILVF